MSTLQDRINKRIEDEADKLAGALRKAIVKLKQSSVSHYYEDDILANYAKFKEKG